jgi:hypothetical protein
MAEPTKSGTVESVIDLRVAPRREADRHVVDLVALEAATQDLAWTAWELERLAAQAPAGPLREELLRLHAGVHAALTRHREVLAGHDLPA